MKVFFPTWNAGVAHMFLLRDWEVTSDPKEADLFQFVGGEDVTPALYGEEPDPRSHFNMGRDLREIYWFNFARDRSVPMAGICRGGQFLNVMGGGKMIQHIEGNRHCNGDRHALQFRNGDTSMPMWVDGASSTHHQMMVSGPRGQVLYTADNGVDTEVVLYSDAVADIEFAYSLCFQPHPEYDPDSDYADLYFNLIDRHLLN